MHLKMVGYFQLNKKILFLSPYFLFFYGLLNLITWYCFTLLSDNLLWRFFSFSAVAFLFILPVITTKYKNYFLCVIGYCWMGFVIYFLSFMAGLILINILFSIISLKLLTIVSILSATLLTIFSFFNKDNIEVKNIEIETKKLQPYANKFKLVQLSDIHWGLFIRDKELAKICRLTNELEPDVILLTGDIIDFHGELNDTLMNHLKQLRAKVLKIMVLGNHELVFNKNELVNFFKKADIVLLNNETIQFDESFNITGVEYGIKDQNLLLKQNNENKYSILISHVPITSSEIIKSFDLQIAGHTHAGQFFPITILTKLIFKYNYGVYKLNSGQTTYVSSGTGTWLPPLRFLTRPEVVAYNLNPSEV